MLIYAFAYVYFFSFLLHLYPSYSFFFFFNDTATTEIYTLSLHDALPIFAVEFSDHRMVQGLRLLNGHSFYSPDYLVFLDRKSTRLNSSHQIISYAVFCLKKKK